VYGCLAGQAARAGRSTRLVATWQKPTAAAASGPAKREESGMLDHLRRSTAGAHGRLEERLRVFERLSAEGPLPLLRSFYGFHQPIEAALRPWAEQLPELDLDRRRKALALERDLSRAGANAATLARLPRTPPPALRTVGDVLGVLYVVEGSTLGGRAIHKACARLGFDLGALSFFDVYGRETGPLWRAFCAVLEARAGCTDIRRDAARTAAETFAAAESFLVDERPLAAREAAVA
jgi:heme oxygenase